jgi:hypothetical protein
MNTSNIAPGTGLRNLRRTQVPLGRVEATQRFTVERPCPICGGYDRATRGQGVRCFGFRSTKGPYVFCTGEEVAGPLPFNTTVLAYRHTFEGPCGCGDDHQDVRWVRPSAEGEPEDAPTLVARYNYHDADGRLVYQMLRFAPKSFAVRHPDGAGGWVYSDRNTDSGEIQTSGQI